MPHRRLPPRVVLAALVGAAVGAGAASLLPDAPTAPPPRQAVSIQIPPDLDVLDVAVSPDAQRIAYTAVHAGRVRLYVRHLDRFDAAVVAGAEGASQPFFSPDGAALGFFAEGFLKTASLAPDAPPPATICRLRGEPAGGAWTAGGTIVFGGPGRSGLLEVAAGGGEPAPLTTVDTDAGETAHGWPQVAGPHHVLYTVGRHGRDPRLALLDRRSGASRPLLPADGGGRFVEPGAVVFARRGEIFAARVELDEANARGAPAPRPVVAGVAGRAFGDRGLGRAPLAAARDGTLVFLPASAAPGDSRLVWVDRGGRAEPVDSVAAPHQTPRIAPDGGSVAFSATTAVLRRDLWRLDLASGARRQLTAAAGDNHSPLWERGGDGLTFASSRSGLQLLFRIDARSGAVAGPLLGGDLRTPGSWAPDGRRLAFHELHPDRERDIWMWRPGGGDEGGPEPWLATPANERAPAFSPDGRWLAYVSDAGGQDGDQVYVRRVDNPTGAPLRVTPAGGTEPVWARTGATLFHRRGRGVWRTAIGADADGRPTATAPEHLFDGAFLADPLANLPAYDVAADGSRFLMLRPADRPAAIRILAGWQGDVLAPPAEGARGR